MITSGGPQPISSSASQYSWPARMSSGGSGVTSSPSGAPASTQLAIVAISSADSEGSFLNSWIPTVRSIYHPGGIRRASTCSLIIGAQGLTSS